MTKAGRQTVPLRGKLREKAMTDKEKRHLDWLERAYKVHGYHLEKRAQVPLLQLRRK